MRSKPKQQDLPSGYLSSNFALLIKQFGVTSAAVAHSLEVDRYHLRSLLTASRVKIKYLGELKSVAALFGLPWEVLLQNDLRAEQGWAGEARFSLPHGARVILGPPLAQFRDNVRAAIKARRTNLCQLAGTINVRPHLVARYLGPDMTAVRRDRLEGLAQALGFDFDAGLTSALHFSAPDAPPPEAKARGLSLNSLMSTGDGIVADGGTSLLLPPEVRFLDHALRKAGRSWADLSKALGVELQTGYKWRIRGIPGRIMDAAADECGVDRGLLQQVKNGIIHCDQPGSEQPPPFSTARQMTVDEVGLVQSQYVRYRNNGVSIPHALAMSQVLAQELVSLGDRLRA